MKKIKYFLLVSLMSMAAVSSVFAVGENQDEEVYCDAINESIESAPKSFTTPNSSNGEAGMSSEAASF
jgi:hypothetical protein